MRKMMTLIAAAGVFALGSGAALALPVPQKPAAATVQTVAQGCGWGYHRGPWGGCRSNYWHGYWGRYCWWRPGPWGPVRVCR